MCAAIMEKSMELSFVTSKPRGRYVTGNNSDAERHTQNIPTLMWKTKQLYFRSGEEINRRQTLGSGDPGTYFTEWRRLR